MASTIKDYCVYWVHLPEHTDRFSQGYIGITNNTSVRWANHKCPKSKCWHFKNAIDKYSENLIWEVLADGLEKDLAMLVENEYRPSPDTGWNLMSGGCLPEWSKESRAKLSKAHTGKTHSEATKKKMRKAKPSIAVTKKAEVICVETGIKYGSAGIASKTLGIVASNIYRALKGDRKTAGGFTWKYTQRGDN